MQDDQEEAARKAMLARLRLEHEDFKLAIDAMNAQRCNPLAIQRMKKKKLDVKDRIERLASSIIPDISA